MSPDIAQCPLEHKTAPWWNHWSRLKLKLPKGSHCANPKPGKTLFLARKTCNIHLTVEGKHYFFFFWLHSLNLRAHEAMWLNLYNYSLQLSGDKCTNLQQLLPRQTTKYVISVSSKWTESYPKTLALLLNSPCMKNWVWTSRLPSLTRRKALRQGHNVRFWRWVPMDPSTGSQWQA